MSVIDGVATFVDVPGSMKVACSVCGRTGYPSYGAGLNGWQRQCLRGHLPCPKCGRMFVVKKDGSARVHPRCPVKP